MKTKTILLYSFDELSEEGKKKALSNLWDLNVDHEWWEYTYEDAERIGLKIMEFDIDRRNYCKGKFIKNVEEVCELILKEHGENCETYKTAKTFLEDKSKLVTKYSDGINTDQVSEDNEYDFDNDCDELEEEFLKSLCEDYRIILRKEYDYLTSEEQIMESIKSNEYTFTENGELEN